MVPSPAAAKIIGTDLPVFGSPAELAVMSDSYIAQDFELTAPFRVQQITVLLSGYGEDLFTLWLTNAVGPQATSANVLFRSDLTFPDTGGGLSGQALSVGADHLLDPGRYYLVLSSAQNMPEQGWLLATGPAPSSDYQPGPFLANCCAPGWSCDREFAPASPFQPTGGLTQSAAFQVLGFEVPEPNQARPLGLALLIGLCLSPVFAGRKPKKPF